MDEEPVPQRHVLWEVPAARIGLAAFTPIAVEHLDGRPAGPDPHHLVHELP